MMKFTRKTSFASEESVGTTKKKGDLGVEAKSLRRKSTEKEDGKFTSLSAQTSMRNTSMSQLPIEVDVDPLLKDIVFSEDLEQKKLITRLYRDIYYNDSIGGSSVDLMSTLPFSDFTLGGLSDPKASQIFNETLERLNCRTIFPHMSTDHLVDGTFLGSLLFNKTTKKFFDIMPHRSDSSKIDPMPFFGQDPLITVSIPEETRALLNSSSPRIAKLRAKLGDEVIALLTNEALELDPVSTIYIPRKTFTTGEGVSWFRRILPLYLIEKNLFRGTLVESSRRQRGIMHLTLGDGEEWEPTVADMEFMTELFMNADADPLGAIIATRMGVTSEELRQGGDFWKVTDMWDSTATFKLRALGISESFLSGEANYATADTSLTVFIEYIRAFRDMLTRKFFYNKIFPLVSMVNGFTVNSRGKLIRKDGLMNSDDVEGNLEQLANGTSLLIPTVHWSKQLKPEGDSTYMDMLTQMGEQGVPVPLRAIAAAGGFNLDALLADAPDDIALLKRISAYTREVADVKKEFGPSAGGEEDAFASGASALESLSEGGYSGARSAVLSEGNGKHVGFKHRDFGDKAEIIQQTRTGKRKYVMNQKRAHERANKNIAKALASITENTKTSLTHTTKTPKKEK